MKNFTDKENARVDFLIEEIKAFDSRNISKHPLLSEYLNELLEYVLLNHTKARNFYCYGE